MGNQRGQAKTRSWYFGAALTVGLVGILLSLVRAQRPVSRVHATDNGQASHDPDSSVAPRSGQINRPGHSYGLGSLVGWAAVRLFGVLLVAGIGVWSLLVGIHSSNWVNPLSVSANATVISSWTDGQALDPQIYASVRFRTGADRIVRATIEPNTPGTLAHGQIILIRYNPAVPSQAAYDDGYYGDSRYGGPIGPGPAYFGAAAWFSLAAALLLIAALWLMGIIRAGPIDVATPMRLKISDGMAYGDHPFRSHGLEWRFLYQPDVAGEVHILGKPGAGRWLIVRLADGRLVWPTSRAQPVLASAGLRLPVVQPGRIGSVHLLLAGYAQIVDLLSALPVVIRRPPGPETKWWRLGALRPMVKTLVTLHLRRMLAELGNALLREALLHEPESHARRILAQASDECQTFARTLPRHNLFAVLATIAATSMTIVSPFLLLPHIPLNAYAVSQYLVPVLAVALIFGVIPLYMFSQSARYKRALFNPASVSSGKQATESTGSVTTGWDVYELERAAFTAVAMDQPVEWASRQRIRWLISAIYLVPITIVLVHAHPVPMLIILGITLASFITVKIYRWQRRIRGLQTGARPAQAVEDTAG